MPRSNEFVDHVLDQMRHFGPVEARAMFGGWGLYHQGRFFALVAEDTLYLKTDDLNRAAFEAQGLEPFVYEMKKKGERIVMHYRRAPEEALESPAVMAEWARRGYEAALRAAAAKASRPRGRRPRRGAAQRG